ncbi:hypothetical protein PSEUBRA_005434 [Kalmanozyma brasiliensis GHG001]|uniref:Uncharacterized protein n=1 Tax=Kalmanozyma brasiliensis (strain GHG001) TaxID=1365824 RepID=V5GGQ3_KALBG|nr:uncharacterized protein PSEUBRA_005434 [Kalmanozyma brasiliensis GHG001]EST05172.1 hypothetical protein PSEUBRA_005434 [Kalmanozyma brasiliensis GHG001]
MTDDDKSATPTRKPRRPFTQLPSALAQLVDDRFDEDQYDQAVDLLDQLKAEGLTPIKSLIQKLVALNLCSLAPGQVASTSRWTLDHQLHDISSRLLTQSRDRKGGQNAMKAASAASDKPSPSAVLKASSLLIQYSRLGADITGQGGDAQAESGRQECLLARHMLEALPSQRRPLQTTSRSVSPESSRKGRRGSARLDDDDHDASFNLSSIERWVRNDFHRAEDVWDLLCDRRFSNPTEIENVALARVSEFWMNESERKRYQKQLQSASTSHRRLEDRLKEIRWKKLNGAQSSDSSDTDTDDSSDDENDDLRLRVSLPGRAAKRSSAKTKGKGKTTSPSEKPAKRIRIAKPAATVRDDDEAHQSKVKMTEGAWRTLPVLLRLWDRATPQDVAATAEATAASDDEPALLWQFPRSHSARQKGGSAVRTASTKDTTDEIGRALDVAFSFPGVLPAYTPATTNTEATTNLFDTAKSLHTRGDARLFSSVPEGELVHRQEVGDQKEERLMALRAISAAWLLASIFRLVKLNHISSVAFTEGVSDRIGALQGQEVQYLMLPLLTKEPFVVASTLTAYLSDATRTRPDKARSPEPTRFNFEDQGVITMDGALAYAMPQEQAAIALLEDASMRQQDTDAKAILHFLSLHRLELDESADLSLSATFPDRSESRKSPVVQKQSRRPVKSGPSSRITGKLTVTLKKPDSAFEAPLTDEMKKGGLVAFAFVRMMQMLARDRINQMKFFVARALVTMYDDTKGTSKSQESYTSTNGSIPDSSQGQDLDLKMPKAGGSERSSQRRNLQLYLTRLSKAFDHDYYDFSRCCAVMRTHLGKDSEHRRHRYLAGLLDSSGPKDGSGAMPSLQTVAERCAKCLDATHELMFSMRLLMESVNPK